MRFGLSTSICFPEASIAAVFTDIVFKGTIGIISAAVRRQSANLYSVGGGAIPSGPHTYFSSYMTPFLADGLYDKMNSGLPDGMKEIYGLDFSGFTVEYTPNCINIALIERFSDHKIKQASFPCCFFVYNGAVRYATESSTKNFKCTQLLVAQRGLFCYDRHIIKREAVAL